MADEEIDRTQEPDPERWDEDLDDEGLEEEDELDYDPAEDPDTDPPAGPHEAYP